MQEILKTICGRSVFTDYVALASFAAGTIFLVISTLKNGLSAQTLKIFATFTILALAFEANTNIVYFFSLLIIATLVTELSFIENITALLTNREWWKVEKASKRDLKEKAIVDSALATNAKGVAQTVTEESHIIKYLGKSVPWTSYKQGVVFLSSQNDKVIFDAIGSTETEDYVIEVATSESSPSISQLKDRMIIFGLVRGKDHMKHPIRGIFITNSPSTQQSHPPHIFYLRYDTKKSVFTNLQDLHSWILKQDNTGRV